MSANSVEREIQIRQEVAKICSIKKIVISFEPPGKAYVGHHLSKMRNFRLPEWFYMPKLSSINEIALKPYLLQSIRPTRTVSRRYCWPAVSATRKPWQH